MRNTMTDIVSEMPHVRGKLMPNVGLAPYTWFRVGGPADALFLPQDEDDLAAFLSKLTDSVPVTILGVGSNLIVRDGGIEGVTVRLMGKYWAEIERVGETGLAVRPGALDLQVAKFAAKEGMTGFSFLSGIPGSMGGAVRTNAGCYGRELSDVLEAVECLDRSGERHRFTAEALGLSYRHSELPDNMIVTRLILKGTGTGDPDMLAAEIESHQKRRAETQPIRDKTSGSTFANPDPPGTPNQRSAWKLVDAAGCRGLRVGGAKISEMHCNFMINTGDARASDLEALGELVRARVRVTSGVDLRWEVRRIGRIQSE